MHNPEYSPANIMSSKRSLKRARTEEEEGESSTTEEGTDVRLSDGLRALFGNRKYVKEREITRAHLMRYLCGKGEITEVSSLHVDIEVSLIIVIQCPCRSYTICSLLVPMLALLLFWRRRRIA